MASQPPIHLLPGLRLAESWTGPEARRLRLETELEASAQDRAPGRRAILHAELGGLAERAGKYEEARAHFEAVVAEDPGMVVAIWALRRQHARDGRLRDWLDTFHAEIAATKDPKARARLWVERALVAWRKGNDLVEARTCLERARSLDPSWVRPYQIAEWLEAKAGDTNARLDRLRELANVVPVPELASAYRVELAWAEWRKRTPEARAAASEIMRAALDGAAGPSAVLDCIEYFAEESGSAQALLETLDERRALVEGISPAAKLEAQSILLSAAAVAAGPGRDPLAALASYRDAAAQSPEPEMLPELVRRATWARAWGVAQTVATALGPSWSLAAAAYAVFADHRDAGREILRARITAAPDDTLARAMLGEIDRIDGAWSSVSGDLGERLVRAETDAERLGLALQISQIDADDSARADETIERLRQVMAVAEGGQREDAFALLEDLLTRTADSTGLVDLWTTEIARKDGAAVPPPYLAERLCDAATRSGDFAAAANVLARAGGAAGRRAALLEEAAQSAAALDALEEAFHEASDPDLAFAIALRAGGLARDRAANAEAAARWFERAHTLKPASIEADEGLDEALTVLDRPLDRAAAVARTLAAIPKDERWITRALERAWLLADADQHVEALVQLEAIEETEAGRPDVWVLRWRILERARAWGPLSEKLLRLSELDERAARSEWILEAAAVVELGLDDPARALRLYVEALDADPESTRARDGVIRAAARVRTPAAVSEAIEVAERDPFGLDPEDLTELAGLAREILEDPDRAGLVARARLSITSGEDADVRVDGLAPETPTPATLGELVTLLGAIQDAESAGDVVRSIALARSLADRTTDRALQASLLVRAARMAEITRGEESLPFLVDAFARAPEEPEVQQALARHVAILGPDLRADLYGRLRDATDVPATVRAERTVLYAEAIAECGELEKAWAAFEDALALDPSSLAAIAGAQDVALEIGEPRRIVTATERLATALADPSQAADTWIDAGHLHMESLHDSAAAIRCFVEADANRPGDWTAFRALRALFLDGGRAGELARLYTRQIGAGHGGSSTVGLLWERAVVEGWTGNLEGAERDLDAVLLADPGHADALEWRAARFAARGKGEAAMELYARLVPQLEAAETTDAEQRLAMACIRVAELAAHGSVDPSVGLDVLARLLARRPTCPIALRYAADLAAQLGQWDDAARSLASLMPLTPSGPARARVAMELCRVQGAQRWDQDGAARAARTAFAEDPLSLDAVLALVDLSAFVIPAEEVATILESAIAARRAARRPGASGRLLAEISLLQRLRGIPELPDLVAAAARLQGDDPDRLVHSALRPAAGRGRADLSHVPITPARGPKDSAALRGELLALTAADPADVRIEGAWTILAPIALKRSLDERIAAAWEVTRGRKPRGDDPLVPQVSALVRLLGGERWEIHRADAVPGVALARRTMTVLGDHVLELLVDARLEPNGPASAQYRVARAVATAMLDLSIELVRHDALVAALVAAASASGAGLLDKLGKKEKAKVQSLLAGVGAAEVDHWFLGRRLGLARAVMALAPHVGSAAKELGTDPDRLEELCWYLGSEPYASLRERLRAVLGGS